MCPAILSSEQRDAMKNLSPATESDLHADQPVAFLRDHLRDLLAAEIEFIDSDEFHEPNAAVTILETSELETPSESREHGRNKNRNNGMPEHLERLCHTPLLTHSEEAALFRRMNFLKFRAKSLLDTVDSEHPDAASLNQIRSDLDEAKATRDRIIHGNIRLVISVVKKFVTPQLSFDEMLSDGIVTLMATVEKFDYSRGFRFSTYAYRSIARAASRTVKTQHREKQRFTDRPENELVDPAAGSIEDPPALERRWEQERNIIAQLIGRLEKREQVIVSGRFALGSECKVQTLRAIARKLGISKERVRQLEKKALAKLREFAQGMFPNAQLETTVP